MKILIVVEGKYPTYSAISKRITNYIKACQLEHNNVEILPLYFYLKSGFSILLFSPLMPLWAYWKVFKRIRHNSMVLICGFGWVCTLSIILASKLRNKSVAVELNEKPYSLYGSRKDDIFKYFYPFHKFCLTKIVYPLADGFLVISDALLYYVRKYKKKQAILSKVPILVDFEFYQKRVEKPDCISPFIIHTATLNDHKDGVINLFRAIARIVSDKGIDLHFYLTSKIGLPITKKLINEIISNNKLEKNVHFLGDLNEDILLAYQQHCSLVVINKVSSEQNRYNFATKLGEYLALGKPVITSQFGEVTNYLQNNVSCLFADPSDVDNIVASIMKILNDPDFGEKIGEEGRKIAESEFDFHAQSKTINKFFSDLNGN